MAQQNAKTVAPGNGQFRFEVRAEGRVQDSFISQESAQGLVDELDQMHTYAEVVDTQSNEQ